MKSKKKKSKKKPSNSDTQSEEVSFWDCPDCGMDWPVENCFDGCEVECFLCGATSMFHQNTTNR